MTSTPTGPANPGTILVVCTGNVCRSPFIEYMLRASLGDVGIGVHSAGTGALVGEPMDPGSQAELGDRGIDARGFVAKQIDRDMVAGADLVIGATREHVGQVATYYPLALRYSFALLDLADLTAATNPQQIDGAMGANRVAKVAAAAASARSRVSARSDEQAELADPYRRGQAAFATMAQESSAALQPIIAALRGA